MECVEPPPSFLRPQAAPAHLTTLSLPGRQNARATKRRRNAKQALSKTGATLASSPLRVLPSKTAIVPVNRDLMPRTDGELERCGRTVYVANVDKRVDREDVRAFFEQLCGERDEERARRGVVGPWGGGRGRGREG